MKRANKRYQPYRALFFFDMDTEFLKLRIICCRTRSQDQFLHAKVQFILVPPPHFRLMPPSLRLLWRRHCTQAIQKQH